MITTRGNIVADGVEFALMQLEVTYDSLASEDSGRNDNGVMQIEWIKSRLRKLKCTLPPTPHDRIKTYLGAVLGKDYEIEYLDPIDGERVLHAYTPGGSLNLYNARIHGGLWYNITFTAIEMGD